MANRWRKLKPRANKLNPPHKSATKRVADKPQKKSPRGGWLSTTLALVFLLASGGLIMAFTWISILYIFNPDQLGWLNKILPAWAQIPLGNRERPKTLKEIQVGLSTQKQIAGETLFLDEAAQNSFLLPVFQQRANCQSDCQEIVELRVYQRSDDLEFQSQPETYYYLATQLPITEAEESFVDSPWLKAASETQDAKVSLPLTDVKRFEDQTPSSGAWFSLRGQRQQGANAIAYGYIVYYNPERTNLYQMLSWSSLSGQPPKWQQVTGGGVKELVLDQTVGLEPHLQVYQVEPVKLFLKPIQLEEITLKPPALDDSAYKNALLLARSGLWTPAFEWLKFIQKQRQGALPAAAQAQMDLIRLHSQLTKTQADKNWASPSQQVLADLMDGRWTKALQVFEASPNNVQEIGSLLKTHRERLWNRAAAALQVNPNKPEVQAWVSLMIAIRQGESSANSWLQSQPKITPKTLAYIQGLLAKLNGEVTKSQFPSPHPSQIVGSVRKIMQVNQGEWLKPEPTAELKLTDNQVWYQVQVSAFHNGQSWLNAPFGNLRLPKNSPGRFLWESLGLSSDSAIKIVVWLPNGEQQITTATIKAVQLRGGVLRLLAAGELITQIQNNALQSKPLALTDAALEWVQPSPITFQELYQQNPQRVKAMLPTVWRSLQQSGDFLPGAIPTFQQMQEKLGDWPVQVIDLTNNGSPEVVLTISQAAIASLNQQVSGKLAVVKNQAHPRTLIVSDSGKVIYTDFRINSPQKLIAIANLGDGQSLALLVENPDSYSLKRWSETNQRFE
ncbi:hypothetical protein Cylst_0565 [Cylindrospermum stagnale PCC 7417]|uniref:Uncharacterized protein n=1 Tax=Cylindrospermum stagnale PCC 7417 TaxID=56107 RepID=K9WR84_9NOST|nr:hypothetical protein [Cylindrospermum stagnale]AFZ22900.1 hypothetical protein Cylst_0565 [Cylindrospermum stagnale PCC 7417]